MSSRPCASSSAAGRCGGSAWATSCCAAPSGWRPSSCPSATAGPTTRSRTSRPARSRSPPRTTASRSSGPTASSASRPTGRCAGRPTSGSPSSRTSTSTTAPWRACGCSTWPAGRCSTTPRPGPARTMPCTSSTASCAASAGRRAPMPKRDDLGKILILGSGPIVIGQAAEFDYSGVQACKVLLEEGYEVVLVNSNPATIMTDPEFATATYVEPLLPGPVGQVIAKERPDALLPTLGGQTALNLAKALSEDGTLGRYGVELIGARLDAINRAEDRDLFRATMAEAGLRVPRNAIAHSLDEAHAAGVPLPVVVRPAFTLGGRGGGIARSRQDLDAVVRRGLAASSIRTCPIDEFLEGWGEFELEVMRDRNDNVVVVCSIENIDPMGVHTGDSVTVAPQQSLTDRQYQLLRDQALAVIRAVGVETGGSNVQFAVNPQTDEIVVIEMNPRVSRSSALASKATGFPIAKIAARLAVGYALEEIPNDITRLTPASFEPAIDYVVVKAPRFAFEKFPGADDELTTHMKSVGEVMAIGRTFQQAFAKALRSREIDAPPSLDGDLLARLQRPDPWRFDVMLEAFRQGATEEEVCARTRVDPWFARELRELALAPEGPFAGLQRSYKAVDTCAAVGGHPRLGPQPHRPGHRVRLLLRARGDDRPRLRARCVQD